MHPLRQLQDLIQARLAAREMVRDAGLGVADQTRFVGALSELGANALDHGGGGNCELSDLSDARHVRLQAVVRDSGGGIADLIEALELLERIGGERGGVKVALISPDELAELRAPVAVMVVANDLCSAEFQQTADGLSNDGRAQMTDMHLLRGVG